MNMYLARYNNALKLMNKINTLLEQGYLIFTDGETKVNKFELDSDGDIIEKISEYCTLIHFGNSIDSDMGYHTTIKEFNSFYKDWVYINPKDTHKLLEEN